MQTLASKLVGPAKEETDSQITNLKTRCDLVDDIANSSISTETISPRIGLNGPRGSLWVGATHENVRERLTVSTKIFGPLSIDTVTDYKTASPWNFVYGCRLMLNEHLELFVEHGFSGRNQVMGSVTARF